MTDLTAWQPRWHRSTNDTLPGPVVSYAYQAVTEHWCPAPTSSRYRREWGWGLELLRFVDCTLMCRRPSPPLVTLLVSADTILTCKYLDGSPPSPVIGMATTPGASVVTVERRRRIANMDRCADTNLLCFPEYDGIRCRKPFPKPLKGGFPGRELAGLDFLPDQAEIGIPYLIYRPA